ncbi:MAG: DUF1127 domain-containing protein [Alphaproteobacteria bacterium]|nr:DUF1127 domain-containing protein [Alphaproteobacteria bacterium]
MVREVRQERAEILGGAIGKTIANAALKLGYGLKKLAHAVESWRQRRATYGELSQLDDRLLADIGIQRADIQVIAAASTDRRVGSGREPSAVGLTRAV